MGNHHVNASETRSDGFTYTVVSWRFRGGNPPSCDRAFRLVALQAHGGRTVCKKLLVCEVAPEGKLIAKTGGGGRYPPCLCRLLPPQPPVSQLLPPPPHIGVGLCGGVEATKNFLGHAISTRKHPNPLGCGTRMGPEEEGGGM